MAKVKKAEKQLSFDLATLAGAGRCAILAWLPDNIATPRRHRKS